MADVVEIKNGPPAVDQTGNLTIWAIPGRTISQTAPSLALLGGASCYRITYSFVTGGWALTAPQEKTTDPRLTAPQIPESLGSVTPSLADLSYVDSVAASSAAVILAGGGEWQFVERRNVAQTSVAVAAQKVRVIDVTLGEQAPGPTEGSGKFTLTQPVAIESMGKVVALVA